MCTMRARRASGADIRSANEWYKTRSIFISPRDFILISLMCTFAQQQKHQRAEQRKRIFISVRRERCCILQRGEWELHATLNTRQHQRCASVEKCALYELNARFTTRVIVVIITVMTNHTACGWVGGLRVILFCQRHALAGYLLSLY